MTKILLVGNSTTAKVIYQYLSIEPEYDILGCLVDDRFVDEDRVASLPCIGMSKLQSTYSPDEVYLIMAMGYGKLNSDRSDVFRRLGEFGYEFLTYIHRDASVYTDLRIGAGCLILPNALVETNVSVGDNTVIWSGSSIAHDSVVGNNVWLATGSVVAGNAVIGDNAFLGVNSTIVNEVQLGSHNFVGAGSLITKNTKDNTVHLAKTAECLRHSATDYVKYFGN